MSEGAGVGVDTKEHLMAAVDRLDRARATELALPHDRQLGAEGGQI
jgi:hypothetical protein